MHAYWPFPVWAQSSLLSKVWFLFVAFEAACALLCLSTQLTARMHFYVILQNFSSAWATMLLPVLKVTQCFHRCWQRQVIPDFRPFGKIMKTSWHTVLITPVLCMLGWQSTLYSSSSSVWVSCCVLLGKQGCNIIVAYTRALSTPFVCVKKYSLEYYVHSNTFTFEITDESDTCNVPLKVNRKRPLCSELAQVLKG